MKIAFVSKYFHPIKGGAENYVLNLALEAVKDGHDVSVFTGDRKGKEKLETGKFRYKGIRVVRCKFLFDLTHYIFLNPALLFEILKFKGDLIHVSGFGLIWHDFILIVKKLISKEIKFINTPHGPFMALSGYNVIQRLLKAFYTLIQKIFLNCLYDAVLQDNTFQWRWIVNYGIKKEKIKFVSVGISSEVIKREISQDKVKQFRERNHLEDKFVISCLGRISRYKGYQHVIDILPQLVKVKEDLCLLIMGRDDGFVRSLKVQAEHQKVKKYIRFLIDVSEDDKYTGLEVSDVFIFPSEWEAFGIVLLEAMTRGNVLISTRTEGGKTLIAEKINGYLYEYGNKDLLLAKLSSIILDKKMIEKMQKENKEKVKNFSWERIYKDQYKPLIKSIQTVKF